MTKGVEQAMMKRSKWRQIRLPIAETMKWIMGSWLFSEISIRNSSETGAGPLLYQSLTCSMWRSSVWQVGRHGDAQVTERQVAIRLSLPSIIKKWWRQDSQVCFENTSLWFYITMFRLCTFLANVFRFVLSPATAQKRGVAWRFAEYSFVKHWNSFIKFRQVSMRQICACCDLG